MSRRRYPKRAEPPEPLHVAPLIDRAIGPDDWVDLFEGMLAAAKKGNASAANILVANRFGKPRQSDATDPRYLSVIRIIDPHDPEPPLLGEARRNAERDGDA